ncbi:MAG: aminodeoxychorismate lyase [Gammaproteobacteria bacterium]|nr:MAG: aminodeoxychorismate lyase [Gammaproteobacteria bacterium]
MNNRVLVNGQEQDYVAVYDRGLQFGDGVFETIAINCGKPLLWDQHMERLLHGCRTLQIRFNDASLLQDEVERLIKSANNAVLKIIITRGITERGYAIRGEPTPGRILMLSAWPDYTTDYYKKGVDVCLCRTSLGKQSVLAGIKHLNRLEQVLARAEWDTEYQEGLMCNEHGCVIEGTMSNLFLVEGDALVTPQLDDCGVKGIVRQVVIEYAKKQNIPFQEDVIPLTRLQQADALFLTNSLIGIWPVRRLERREYPPSELITTLQSLIKDVCTRT